MEESHRRRRRAINSPLGSVSFESPEGQNRVLRVDDPTEQPVRNMDTQGQQVRQVPPELIQNRTFTAGSVEPSISSQDFQEIERQVQEAREQQRRERPSRGAVNRLELLTGIGRLLTEVEIEKVVFTLRSLKSKELRYVMEKAAKEANSNIGEALMIRNYTLGFALYQIDGNPIYSVIGSDDIEDKVEILDDFEESVTAKLWDTYSRMINEGSKDAEKDLGSTPEEIVNNVKKS